ncbi:hypothetical protein J6590_009393 [Homalodisca vitripennis]|nr:hypothetical protein J6590_009393 [Homalodisca vitripennis]
MLGAMSLMTSSLETDTTEAGSHDLPSRETLDRKWYDKRDLCQKALLVKLLMGLDSSPNAIKGASCLS